MALTFFVYAQTTDGTMYSWVETKEVSFQMVFLVVENTGSMYPNSWDVTSPQIVRPLDLTVADTVWSAGPYCSAYPTLPDL